MVFVQAGCAAVAILLHYFFLTSFMWMLMEGVVLYIMLVRVFAQVNWRYYVAFGVISYGKADCSDVAGVKLLGSFSPSPGAPLLYMILCIPLGLARTDEWSYGSDDV